MPNFNQNSEHVLPDNQNPKIASYIFFSSAFPSPFVHGVQIWPTTFTKLSTLSVDESSSHPEPTCPIFIHI